MRARIYVWPSRLHARNHTFTHDKRIGENMRERNTGATICTRGRARPRVAYIVRMRCNGTIHMGSACSDISAVRHYDNAGDRITHASTTKNDGAQAMCMIKKQTQPRWLLRHDVRIIHTPHEYYIYHVKKAAVAYLPTNTTSNAVCLTSHQRQ